MRLVVRNSQSLEASGKAAGKTVRLVGREIERHNMSIEHSTEGSREAKHREGAVTKHPRSREGLAGGVQAANLWMPALNCGGTRETGSYCTSYIDSL